MASLLQRGRDALAILAGRQAIGSSGKPAKIPLPETKPPYATAVRTSQFQIGAPKRGTHLLRRFSVNNEWVRAAISRRKAALAYANHRIVRIDDPKKPPDPGVVDAVNDLFKFCNPTRESFQTVLKKIVEDILVLDAGCIEKLYSYGGQLAGLTAVDGASIYVDPTWELACDPKAPRYFQYDNYVLTAQLLNDELIYMMHNPRTSSAIGWSPVETLVRVIEAELYTESYDFSAMKQNVPEVAIDLGPGISQGDMTAFREFYETEIAGTNSTLILGGYDDDAPEPMRARAAVIPIPRSGQSVDREAYKKYLATKIAAVFEIDLVALGLIENVNRSTSKTGAEQSDRGLVGLARTVQEYITREIIWEIDPDHGFEFDGIVPVDELTEAKVRQLYIQMGATTPNEIRAEQGLDPVEWGEYPYWFQSTQTPNPLDPDAPGMPQNAPPPKAPVDQDGNTVKPPAPVGPDGKPVTPGTPAAGDNGKPPKKPGGGKPSAGGSQGKANFTGVGFARRRRTP